MFKVLIVDDEILVRAGLRTTIDWNQYGFEIIGEAANGQKALEIAFEEKPDIVLTDIKMPKMDGLELTKELKKHLPGTKVIILSCYNDFEYVREAMQSGALDFIPKLSMKPSELSQLLERCKELIENEQMQQEKIEKIQREINNNLYILQGRFFNKVVIGENPWESFAGDIEFLKLNIAEGLQVPVCFCIESFKHLSQQNIMGSEDLLVFSIINIANELVDSSNISGNTFYINEGEFMLWLSFPQKNDTFELVQLKIIDMCKKLNGVFHAYLDISTSFAIGEGTAEMAQFGSSCNAAARILGFRFYKGCDSIFAYTDIPAFQYKGYYDSNKEKQFRTALVSGERDRAAGIIHELLSQIKNEENISPDAARQQVAEIIHTCSSAIKEFEPGYSEHDVFKEGSYNEVLAKETFDELIDWVGNYISDTVKFISISKKEKVRPEIEKSLKYILVHFCNKELSLKDVANHIGLNEAYFSYLFKKETGCNFINYVNKVRIEKSKEYLKDKNISIYQIAENTGYSDLTYFSRVFKQLTGYSPAGYRKNVLI